MTCRAVRGLVAAAACAAAASLPTAQAQSAVAAVKLLEVPYLAQTESLCGGAAAAMVMRFWGSTDVYPESFGGLIDRAAGGIHAADLVERLREWGWDATAFRGDAAIVRSHLEKGRPVVALIQDHPKAFHYIVIVGWHGGRVVVHDPARAPFRVIEERAFVSAWDASNRWTLLALPPKNLPSPDLISDDTTEGATGLSNGCTAMVDEGVRLANAGEIQDARRVLEGAASSCPAAPDPWRELAGVHALERDWKAAANDAREALARDTNDEHAARILATSLFLENRRDDALAVWNRLGEPTIDLVNVVGLERTRYEVVAKATMLEHGRPLTVAGLARARRRLADVPSVMTSRVSFTPTGTGHAQVDAAVVERPLMPTGSLFLAATGARAATDRELSWAIASPSGGGEMLSMAWRWWENRPRGSIRVSAPSPGPLGGVWTVDAFAERQTYGTVGSAVERRSGVAFKTADWLNGQLRWEAGIGFDDWDVRGTSLSLSAGVERHLLVDRLILSLRGSRYTHDVRASTAGARVQWRSTIVNEGRVWLAESGIETATRTAPRALWSGAGTGQGRDVLLRAHPLLSDGVIDDGVFGRRLAHANLEWRSWTQWSGKPVRIAPALFLDAAQAHQDLIGLRRRTEIDAGAGARVAIPGGSVLRIDVARGLRDGAMAFSIGWTH